MDAEPFKDILRQHAVARAEMKKLAEELTEEAKRHNIDAAVPNHPDIRSLAEGNRLALTGDTAGEQPTTAATPVPPTITATFKAALEAFNAALSQPVIFNDPAVSHAIEREYRIVMKLAEDHKGSDKFPAGPVLAILLDPDIPKLNNEKLAARVAALVAATKHTTTRRVHLAIGVPLAAAIVIGVMALYVSRGGTGLMVLLPPLAAMAAMLYAGSGRTRFPRLALGDASMLAHLRRNPILPYGPAFDSLPLDQSSQSRPTAVRSVEDTATRRAAARLTPRLRKPGTVAPQPNPANPADRERRITEVHAAVAELDSEWLEYTLDTNAWFLTKPQLRNNNDPVIAAYRHAQADLRDLADALTPLSADTEITAAQQAARRALTAWGAANTHALKIGVSDLSPSEEAALKRLHGLVNTLNDRSTPREMWADLKAAIIRTMDKLTVTSFDLIVIAELPVISAESRLRALPAAPTPQPPTPAFGAEGEPDGGTIR
ncbi:hypothetical protein [Mycolicibacterium llatzerense]|uniref:hypothetical protein n=1 Tax=Mycolicibacterium llatzerense TaxID=280871 RepID=UPI0021B527DA|nr:hypothetical protein [Mycolicibacterium llatzerense]